MILGQLGRTAEAQAAVAAVLELQPGIRETFRDMARIWKVPDPQIEQMAEGLRKAGRDIRPPPDSMPESA